MTKYRYDPIVTEHQRLVLVPMANKVGVSTKAAALQWSAIHAETPVEVSICSHGEMQQYDGHDVGFLLVFAPGTPPEAITPLLQSVSTSVVGSVYGTEYYGSPAYSEEYEAFLGSLQNALPFLLELLPDSYPGKADLIAARDAFELPSGAQ